MTTDGAVAAGSGAGPTELYPSGDESADDVGRENVFAPNDTREALSHDGSEHNSVSAPGAFLHSSISVQMKQTAGLCETRPRGWPGVITTGTPRR